jgi:hypothetical protein
MSQSLLRMFAPIAREKAVAQVAVLSGNKTELVLDFVLYIAIKNE